MSTTKVYFGGAYLWGEQKTRVCTTNTGSVYFARHRDEDSYNFVIKLVRIGDDGASEAAFLLECDMSRRAARAGCGPSVHGCEMLAPAGAPGCWGAMITGRWSTDLCKYLHEIDVAHPSDRLAMPGYLELCRKVLRKARIMHEAGIWHQDLMPRNVLLRVSDGVVEDACITDFGMALPTSENDHLGTERGCMLAALDICVLLFGTYGGPDHDFSSHSCLVPKKQSDRLLPLVWDIVQSEYCGTRASIRTGPDGNTRSTVVHCSIRAWHMNLAASWRVNMPATQLDLWSASWGDDARLADPRPDRPFGVRTMYSLVYGAVLPSVKERVALEVLREKCMWIHDTHTWDGREKSLAERIVRRTSFDPSPHSAQH